MHPLLMNGTSGIPIAVAKCRVRRHGITWILLTRARMIWIRTASGAMCRITGRCGRQTMWVRIGLRTAMEIGCGNLTTVGRGLGTSHGAGRRITMDAGSVMAARGAGGRENAAFVRNYIRSEEHTSELQSP